MTCNLRLSGVKFQKSQKVGLVGHIIRQNGALDIVFSEKLFPRSFRVTQGQKLREKVKKVKFRTCLKIIKLYVKIKLLTSSFQKTISKVIQDHSRSKIRRKGQISNLLENNQIIRQHEALDIVISEKLFPRSFRVTQGQKLREKVEVIGWPRSLKSLASLEVICWIRFLKPLASLELLDLLRSKKTDFKSFVFTFYFLSLDIILNLFFLGQFCAILDPLRHWMISRPSL